MSALEGISPEQLAAIARLFQSGALQMPPPAAAALTHAPPAAQSSSGPPQTQPVPQLSRQTGVEVSTAIAPQVEDDMDAEEGEVDESEHNNTPAKMRDFLRPPPTGPKNRSVSPHQRLQKKNKRSASPRPTIPTPAAAQPSPQSNHRTSNSFTEKNGTHALAKDEAAKMFVLEMVRAGFSYNDIALEVKNSKALMRMFHDLHLPLRSTESTERPLQPNGLADVHPVPSMKQGEVPTASFTKRAVSEKPAPPDRNTYLAKLQAAKNKKADAITSATELTRMPLPAPESATQPAPAKRNDYLARLQAAKNKKPEVSVAPSPMSLDAKATLGDVAPGPAQEPMATSTHSSNVAPTSKAQTPAVDGNKAASLTELARQRLLALQAKQTHATTTSSAPANVLPAGDDPELAATEGGLGAGLANIPSLLAQQPPQPLAPSPISIALPPAQSQAQQVAPPPQTPSRSFSSLPGLFMSGSTAQSQAPSSSPQVPRASQLGAPIDSPSVLQQPHSTLPPSDDRLDPAAAAAEPAEPRLSRKRPVASDFDYAQLAAASSKRPFGQSRNASEDESLVIQVSDSDDNDDEMEVEGLPESAAKSAGQTRSFRDVGPLRDFPSKPIFHTQTSTPGTPGGITYEQKMKEIEEFKRRIAEREKRTKPNGKAVVTPSQPFTPNEESQTTQGPLPTNATAQVEPAATDSSPVTVGERSLSAAQVTRQQEKERLRRRLLELQQQVVQQDNQFAKPVELGPEHVQPMSGIVLNEPLYTGPPDIEPHKADLNDAQREASAQDSKSEEGELTDDSMSGIYEVEDDEVDEQQIAAELADKSQGEIQPDNISAIDQLNRTGDVHATAAPLQDMSSRARSTSERTSSTPTMASAIEHQASQHETEDVNADFSHHESPQRDIEYQRVAAALLPLADSTRDKISSEERNGMNEDLQHNGSSQSVHISDGANTVVNNGVVDLGDSDTVSSTSSSAQQSAEPAQDQLISDTIDLTNDSNADDDLAPELQPTQEVVQAMTPDQVRGNIE